MSINITIPVEVLTYKQEELDNWRNGIRGECIDTYCREKLRGTYGFGEFIVGRHFEKMGYKWIHHDFTLFGACKLGKYPLADKIFTANLGEKRYHELMNTQKINKNIVLPDLLIYNDDYSEIRFAESKLLATRDYLRESQKRGIVFLSSILNYKVDLFEVIEENMEYNLKTLSWEF